MLVVMGVQGIDLFHEHVYTLVFECKYELLLILKAKSKLFSPTPQMPYNLQTI